MKDELITIAATVGVSAVLGSLFLVAALFACALWLVKPGVVK